MLASETLLTDLLNVPEVPVQKRPATDSSRVLLGLLDLSRTAAMADPAEAGTLEGVIAPALLRQLLSALHFRDVATVMHSRRAASLAVGIARHLGWEGRHLKLLEIASLMHDIGKIGVPDNILFKPGKLNSDEADLMSLHHAVGVDVLQACRVDPEAQQIVSEARDFAHDTARAFQLSGGTVHLGARILSVADAYDSLRTDQVYRQGKSHEETMRILSENAGSQFDGNIVSALARWSTTPQFGEAVDYHATHNPALMPAVFADARDAQDADSLCGIFSYLYLLENLYDGFYVVDAERRFAVWSSGMQQLLGYRPDEMLNHTWSRQSLSYADQAGRPLSEQEAPLWEVMETERAMAKSVRVHHADGHWTEVETQTVPLIDEHGKLRGIAEIFRGSSQTERAPREYRDLRLAATRDPLTGVANRGELEKQLEHLTAETVKGEWKTPFSVIFVDVDHFKQTNDQFGHATGDIVLIELARLFQQETYSGELVGRYGGEEFVILCPATDLEQAAKRAERIRLAVSRLQLPELEGTPLTASFGVTQAVPGDTPELTLRRADKALYAAKNGGRNQTRTLTAAEEVTATTQQDAPDLQPTGEFEFRESFRACTQAEMVVYKLSAFLENTDAQLKKVTTDRVEMQAGRRGLLSSWGKSDDRKPVDIVLEFSDSLPPREFNGRKVRSNQVMVHVRITPVGLVRQRDVFEARARQVLKELSTHFMADVDQHG